MKGYFVNSELKISSATILILMCIFFSVDFIGLKYNNDKLKESYINSVGAIAEKVVEKNPDMEKDIMPIVTKGATKEESSKGKALLSNYGITKSLEDNIFPNTNHTIKNKKILSISIFVILAAIFLFLNCIQHIIFYKRIRKLAFGANKVIEGEYDIAIDENIEGDFSKLASSFNSMREIIRNNINDLKKEKQFLADILSDISHQLKTPLSSMIIYNDIMVNKELSKEQRHKFLISNQSQLERMNNLIKNMLKLAKLDAKAIEFNIENQNLNETVHSAIDALESKSVEAQVKIIFEEEKEVFFPQDNLWLEEAFINIIKNGIEHTSLGGEIHVSLYENPLYIRISIEDNGEGIKEEDLPNIFKRFYKAKSSKKTDSVGIGLALSKAIIEAHSGIIEVKSQLGVGTKFTITLIRS